MRRSYRRAAGFARGLTPAPKGMNRYTQLTLRDLRDGALSWHIWGHLGWQDVKLRYRRSKLGPLWLTLSAAIFIASIGLLYGGFFGQTSTDFVPYLAVGFIV